MNTIAILVLLFIFEQIYNMIMNKRLYQIIVKGKVQGVWFRKYTYDQAIKIGLVGFVRNQLDKSVYIEAEGSLIQLNKFMEWLYIGSPLSKVNSVKYELGDSKNYSSFEIRP